MGRQVRISDTLDSKLESIKDKTKWPKSTILELLYQLVEDFAEFRKLARDFYDEYRKTEDISKLEAIANNLRDEFHIYETLLNAILEVKKR